MKLMAYTASIILILIALLVSSSACSFIKLGGQKSVSSGTSSSTIISEWSMTRQGIEPPFPSEIPDMLVDQILPKSSTWKIVLSGNKPSITYNGKKIWFNSLGFNVTINTSSFTLNQDNKSGVITGGGHLGASRLPGALAIIGMAKGIGNVSINYTDRIDITLNSPEEITAIITYKADGSYQSSDGNESLNNHGKLTYKGKRK